MKSIEERLSKLESYILKQIHIAKQVDVIPINEYVRVMLNVHQRIERIKRRMK